MADGVVLPKSVRHHMCTGNQKSGFKVGKIVISYKSIHSRNFICQNGHISLTVGWHNIKFGGMEERGSQIYVKKFSSDMFSAKSFSTPPQNLWLFFFTQGHKELVKLHNPSLLIIYRYILRPSCQEPSPVYRNSKSVWGRLDRENPNENVWCKFTNPNL